MQCTDKFAPLRDDSQPLNVGNSTEPYYGQQDGSLSTLDYSFNTETMFMESTNSLDYSINLEAPVNADLPPRSHPSSSNKTPFVRQGRRSSLPPTMPRPPASPPTGHCKMKRRGSFTCTAYSSPSNSPSGRPMRRRASLSDSSGEPPRRRGSLGSYTSPARRRSSMGSYPIAPRRPPLYDDLTPVISNKKTPAPAPKLVGILRRGCFSGRTPLAGSSPIESPVKEGRRRVTFDIPEEAPPKCTYEDGSMQFGDILEFTGDEEQNVMDVYGAEIGRAALYQMMGKSEHGFGNMMSFGDDADDSLRFGVLREDDEEEAPSYGNSFSYSSGLENHEDAMGSIHGMGSGDELAAAPGALDFQEPLIEDGNAASTNMEEAFNGNLDLSAFEDGWADEVLPPLHSRDESVSSETSSESPKGIQEFPEECHQEFVSKLPDNGSPSAFPGESNSIE